VSFRKLKAQIYWPTTDQKVRGSNPCGRTKRFELKIDSCLLKTETFSYLISKPLYGGNITVRSKTLQN